MRNTYLLLTVGGSDEPVVSSIKNNKPDYIYFICSDDTEETKGSYHTIDGEGRPCGFVAICKKCNHSSGSTRENIVSQASLTKDNYEVIKVSKLDDLNECYLTASAIIKTIRKDDPMANIIADYTGGTKSMTSGLASAAMDDGNTEICVVKGRRVDLHKVKQGTQSARIIESNKIFIEKKLTLLNNLWHNYDFQSCLEIINDIFSRPLSDDLSDRLDTIRYLCQGFEAWDRFDHSTAIDHLKPYKDKLKNQVNNHLIMLGEINCVKEWWPNQQNNNPENKNMKQRQQIYSFAPVFDLILNAWRREKQGRYDDAVARLYRALELFGQINLLRWNQPLNSSDLDLDKIPKKLSDKYAVNVDRTSGKVTLALIQTYILLQELETPVGRLFNKHKDKLRAVLNIRNNSLMAHGITPVSTQDCQKTKQALDIFIRESLSALDTKMPYLQNLQFPADLLQTNSLV